MDEVESQSKRSLVIRYVFSSLMIISLIFIILASSIVFKPEEIINPSVRLGSTFGFISFIFIFAMMLMTHLENLIDTIRKLNEGDYYE